MSVSTHVLDSVLGRPAMGIPVRLFAGDVLLAEGVTDLSVYDCVPGGDLQVDLYVDRV